MRACLVGQFYGPSDQLKRSVCAQPSPPGLQAHLAYILADVLLTRGRILEVGAWGVRFATYLLLFHGRTGLHWRVAGNNKGRAEPQEGSEHRDVQYIAWRPHHQYASEVYASAAVAMFVPKLLSWT